MRLGVAAKVKPETLKMTGAFLTHIRRTMERGINAKFGRMKNKNRIFQ